MLSRTVVQDGRDSRELASGQRRFGYWRHRILLRREGCWVNRE